MSTHYRSNQQTSRCAETQHKGNQPLLAASPSGKWLDLSAGGAVHTAVDAIQESLGVNTISQWPLVAYYSYSDILWASPTSFGRTS